MANWGGLANGALGYGLYFLQRGYYNRSFAQSIVEELVQGIARYAIHTPDGCYWKSGLNHTSPKAGLFSPDETAAVLLFLARIVEMGLCPAERMEGIAQKAVSYIETCRRNTGDIETGYTLLRAGIAFNNAAWARSGREDLRRYAISRQENADLIKDAGIVHGAAGLALLFDRITQIGNDPTIERAADFWYAQILRFGGHPDGYAGYMAAEHPWNLQINLAFCQGIMGIGSTLIRALHPEVHFDDLIWSV
ncbi:hypothetical protein [Dyadobacter sp. 676]|uniref:Lanthionine synthetase C family protein n=1 Tax=Dyadobacter sp. 676 TaxID=3088362 RepID=A0AAU8FPT8_9BACT